MFKKFMPFFFFVLAGCQTTGISDLTFLQTKAEQLAGYTYVPLEPSRVIISPLEDGSKLTKARLLNALPDNSIRIATRQIGATSDTNIAPIGLNTGTAGNTYEVIIDYITADTVNVKFFGYWQPFNYDVEGNITRRASGIREFSKFPKNTPAKSGTPGTRWELVIYARESLLRKDPSGRPPLIGITDGQVEAIFNDDLQKTSTRVEEFIEFEPTEHRTLNEFHVPVYAGVALRLTINVTVLRGEVHFTGLSAITTAVEAERATGSMTVQTIGITGTTPRNSLQIISSIDDTAIVAAVSDLAAVKASIETDSTVISPRIVGFHNTAGLDQHGINRIHSLLSAEPIVVDLNTITSVAGPAVVR